MIIIFLFNPSSLIFNIMTIHQNNSQNRKLYQLKSMSFSQLIQDKYFDSQTSSITLCYQQISYLSPVPFQFQSITSLTINHCQLQSLTHIDQFENLQHLSIKYNSITSIKELFKIKNKAKLISLDFRGNDIQHMQNARIQKLKGTFCNLVELNGTDYRFMELNRVAGRKQVEAVRVLHRLDTLGAILQSMNKDPSMQKEKQRAQNQSRVMTSQRKPKPKSKCVPDEKENRESQFPTQRRKELHISTGGVDPVSNQPCQPTATFARQKQIEQKIGIGFKKEIGLSRIERKSEHTMDVSLMMRYATNPMANTSNQSGLFPDLNKNLNENKEDLVEGQYLKTLLEKTYYAWKQLCRYRTNNIHEDRPFRRQWPLE